MTFGDVLDQRINPAVAAQQGQLQARRGRVDGKGQRLRHDIITQGANSLALRRLAFA